MAESKKTQIAAAALLLVTILCIARPVVVGVHHIELSDAIHVYRMECIANSQAPVVDYSDKEDYYATLFRLWDWSKRRILDKYDYMVIEPYIGQADSAEFAGQYFGG